MASSKPDWDAAIDEKRTTGSLRVSAPCPLYFRSLLFGLAENNIAFSPTNSIDQLIFQVGLATLACHLTPSRRSKLFRERQLTLLSSPVQIPKHPLKHSEEEETHTYVLDIDAPKNSQLLARSSHPFEISSTLLSPFLLEHTRAHLQCTRPFVRTYIVRP